MLTDPCHDLVEVRPEHVGIQVQHVGEPCLVAAACPLAVAVRVMVLVRLLRHALTVDMCCSGDTDACA